MPENNGNSGKSGSNGFGNGNGGVNGNSGITGSYSNTNNRIGEMSQKPEKMPEKKKIITDWGDEEDLDTEIENEKNIPKPNNNNISPKQSNFSVINPNNTGSKNSLNGMEKSKNSSTASFISENSQKNSNVRTLLFFLFFVRRIFCFYFYIFHSPIIHIPISFFPTPVYFLFHLLFYSLFQSFFIFSLSFVSPFFHFFFFFFFFSESERIASKHPHDPSKNTRVFAPQIELLSTATTRRFFR
jgi:hypothetical protein